MINSTKSMTGHLLGAAGGIESAICAKVILEGKVPPTINQYQSDPDCDLNYVPNQMCEAKVNVAICNNSGFGGQRLSCLKTRIMAFRTMNLTIYFDQSDLTQPMHFVQNFSCLARYPTAPVFSRASIAHAPGLWRE